MTRFPFKRCPRYVAETAAVWSKLNPSMEQESQKIIPRSRFIEMRTFLNGVDELCRSGDAVTGKILSKRCESLLEVYECGGFNLRHETQEYSTLGTGRADHRFSLVSKGDHDR